MKTPPPKPFGFVYYLADPRSPWVPRYDGKTVQPLAARLRQHVYDAEHGGRSPHDRGIRKLLRAGVRPVIRPLEPVFSNHDVWVPEIGRLGKVLAAAECRWITAHCAAGLRLWNVTPGGDGFDSETASRLMRTYFATLSHEQKQVIARRASAAAVGTRTLEQMRESARKMKAACTPEQRREHGRRWAASTNAKLGRERKREIILAVTASLTPEQRSVKARKSAAGTSPEIRRARGLKGAAALYAKTSPEQRREWARKAGVAGCAKRWSGHVKYRRGRRPAPAQMSLF